MRTQVCDPNNEVDTNIVWPSSLVNATLQKNDCSVRTIPAKGSDLMVVHTRESDNTGGGDLCIGILN